MIARGQEGINSLSISNAAYLSARTDSRAEIPTDEALFEKYLKENCDKESKKTMSTHVEDIEALRKRWKVRW